MLGAQVSRIEVEHADRVAADEQLELVGRDLLAIVSTIVGVSGQVESWCG